MVDGLPDGAPVGLRVYGHRVPNTDRARGCADTELIAPVAPLDKTAMKAAIGSFQAKGFTPIGASLRAAVGDLPPQGERTVLLVSDGVDTCAPPEACQVARELAASGVGLKVEAVGFQVDTPAREQLRCIAEATGGSYRDAPDAAALAQESVAVSARALRTFAAAGRVVRGGPDQQSATTVTPGTYRDDIAPNQTLWYGVRVEPGQTLRVAATLVGDPAGRDLVGPSIRVRLFDGTGDARSSDTQTRLGRSPVTASAEAAPRRGEPPSTYSAEIDFRDGSGAFGATAFALELSVELTGTPSTTTTVGRPTTTAATTATATATPDVVAPAAGDGEGSTSGAGLVYLACAVAGAGLGAGGAALAARRRAR